MTPRHSAPVAPVRRGFTLVEILVVIGIIVILLAILVPMVGRAMRQAKQTRTAADMATIATVLNQFKLDTGDYPRTDTGVFNTGAAILGRYLNGPLGDGFLPGSTSTALDDPDDPVAYDGAKEYFAGDVVTSGIANTFVALKPNKGVATSDTTAWAPCNNLRDGLDGPGIRHGSGKKKIGPLITTDKMKMQGIAFVDGNGNPILYFPASTAKMNLLEATPGGNYVNRVSAPTPTPTGGASKASIKYDADDNFEAFRRTPTEANNVVLERIRAYLGDYDGDGIIETNLGEKVVTENEYLLWAAGTDGKFGPEREAMEPTNTMTVTDVDRCDDVVNFK